MKPIKIETFEDMLNAVTIDNLDNFINDLSAVLRASIAIRESGLNITNEKYYLWIDDGKREITLNIRSDETN